MENQNFCFPVSMGRTGRLFIRLSLWCSIKTDIKPNYFEVDHVAEVED